MSTDTIPPMPTFGNATESILIEETQSWSESAALDELYPADKPRHNPFKSPPVPSNAYSRTINARGPSTIDALVSAGRVVAPRTPGTTSSVYSQATNQPSPSGIAKLVAADNAADSRIPGLSSSVYSRNTDEPSSDVGATTQRPLTYVRPLNVVKPSTPTHTRYVEESDNVPSPSDLADAEVGDRIEKDGVFYEVTSSEQCNCYRGKCHLHRPIVVSRRKQSKKVNRRNSPLIPLAEDSETNFESFESFNNFARTEKTSAIYPGKAKLDEKSSSGASSKSLASPTYRYRSSDKVWNELVNEVNGFTTTRKLKAASLSYADVTGSTSMAGWRNSVAQPIFSGVSTSSSSDDEPITESVPKTEAYYELMEVLRKFSEKHGLPETDEAGVWPERPSSMNPEGDTRRDTSMRLQEFPPRC